MPPVSLALAASSEPRLNSSSWGCPGQAACRLGDLGDLIQFGSLSGDAPTQDIVRTRDQRCTPRVTEESKTVHTYWRTCFAK